MPPTGSKSSKRKSSKSPASPPPSQRPRVQTRSSTIALEPTIASPSAGATTSSTVREPVSVASTSAAPDAGISPQLLQQIVSTVTAEVTRRLTPHHEAELSDAVVEAPVVAMVATTSTEQPAIVPGIVEEALQSVHSAVAGEPSSYSAMPSQPYESIHLPLDSRITTKLKNKIWNDEYIAFGSLLSNPGAVDTKFQLSVMTSNDGLHPSLSFEPVHKPQKVAHIATWMSAFRIFVGVYTQKYPHESPALMKYGDIVQDLADRGHNWRFYDENFRFLRQKERSAVPWANVHWELWLRSQYPTNRSVGPGQRAVANTTKLPFLSIPRGHCFRFHKGEECSGCEFKHSCFKCAGSHPAIRCNFRGLPKRDQNRNARSDKRNAAPNPHTNKSS